MKELFLGIVLILVLGIAGFLYRNTMEQPARNDVTACTMEARVCPDGSAVGRSGPDCSFAACAFPNIELPEAGIAFAIPPGYTQPDFSHPDLPLVWLEKPTVSASVKHSIQIDLYEIPTGKTADQVILAQTRYQPADMQAEDFSRFTSKTIGGRTFRGTVIERFEAQVMSSYFLARSGDVLRFDIVERDVTNWTDADLVVENLPEHAALLRMLATLQTN